MKIGAEVESGRYTPTAKASEETPQSSRPPRMATPNNTRTHGSFWFRMPLVIRANSSAWGGLYFLHFGAVVAGGRVCR